MATTAIGTDRSNTALQEYPDAVFVRDDMKLYFGNDGDAYIELDAAGSDTLNLGGANIRIADNVRLQFGDSAESYVVYDEAGSDTLTVGGANIRILDDVRLQFGTSGDTSIRYNADSDVIVFEE